MYLLRHISRPSKWVYSVVFRSPHTPYSSRSASDSILVTRKMEHILSLTIAAWWPGEAWIERSWKWTAYGVKPNTICMHPLYCIYFQSQPICNLHKVVVDGDYRGETERPQDVRWQPNQHYSAHSTRCKPSSCISTCICICIWIQVTVRVALCERIIQTTKTGSEISWIMKWQRFNLSFMVMKAQMEKQIVSKSIGSTITRIMMMIMAMMTLMMIITLMMVIMIITMMILHCLWHWDESPGLDFALKGKWGSFGPIETSIRRIWCKWWTRRWEDDYCWRRWWWWFCRK